MFLITSHRYPLLQVFYKKKIIAQFKPVVIGKGEGARTVGRFSTDSEQVARLIKSRCKECGIKIKRVGDVELKGLDRNDDTENRPVRKASRTSNS